jgi:hypothetical protein
VLAQQAAKADRLSSALTATSLDPDIKTDIRTPCDINQVLAQLFSAVSLRKIDLRQGALLDYIVQLMIQTTKVADVKAQLPKSYDRSLHPHAGEGAQAWFFQRADCRSARKMIST